MFSAALALVVAVSSRDASEEEAVRGALASEPKLTKFTHKASHRA